jgi:hypothetical protein
MVALIEHLEKWYSPDDYTESDTGKTDGTVYFTPTAFTGYDHLLDCIYVNVVDTPGAAGTNTYTVEATIDAGVSWFDVTNAWLGSASFTTHFGGSAAYPTPVDNVRIKRVRTGDAANNDGGSATRFRRRRYSV